MISLFLLSYFSIFLFLSLSFFFYYPIILFYLSIYPIIFYSIIVPSILIYSSTPTLLTLSHLWTWTCAAWWRALSPLLSLTFGLALFFNNNWVILRYPALHAVCNAVIPWLSCRLTSGPPFKIRKMANTKNKERVWVLLTLKK